MNTVILLELAKRWENDALKSEQDKSAYEVGSDLPAIQQGHREAKRECADVLRMLVSALG